MRYFLKLAYDGTPFHGWQRQPNATSVQQALEEALSIMFQSHVDIVGAGRTDTGVHAREMFAHLDIDNIADKKRFLTSLNRLAGPFISIYKFFPVKSEAHARFDALSRTYIYRISLFKDPFDSAFAHIMQRLPDVEKMNRASSLLLQTDDFTSFAKLHSDSMTNICKVTEASWIYDENKGKLSFRISANRFLRNMVRSIVGTLLDVGNGKLSIEDFAEIIRTKDRCAAGVSMPAKGLSLSKIIYPSNIFLSEC